MEAVGVDTAGLILRRLDPWSRGRCACINRAWKRAVDTLSLQGANDWNNQHWLVEAVDDKLWMWNIVTGQEQMVNLDFAHVDMVLCCFQGLVLINLAGNTLALGDPLLNRWIKLPDWPLESFKWSGAAFCPATRTLMVTDIDVGCTTAIFDLATAQWKLERFRSIYDKVFCPMSRPCCLDGVFYWTLVLLPEDRDFAGCGIACYDPASNNDRQWRVVEEFYALMGDCFSPIFATQTSHNKLLLYMRPDCNQATEYQLFEASRKSSSSYDLEIVPSPIMDEENVGRRIKFPVYADRPDDVLTEGFYGKDDMLFWVGFDVQRRGKVTVVYNNQKPVVKELHCPRSSFAFPSDKCYYSPDTGAAEMLNSLALVLGSYIRD